MKKLITSLTCIVFLSFANQGQAQGTPGECMQTTSSDGSNTNVVNTSGAGFSVCKPGLFSCSGTCQGQLPPAGSVCTTCVSFFGGPVERKYQCTPGTTPLTTSPVQAPCNGGMYSCGCSSNWTAVSGGAPGTIYCGADGDAC